MRLKHLLAATAIATCMGGHALAEGNATLDLVEPIADYKIYISEKLEQLVADTRAFTGAVKAGDVEKA